MLVDRSETPTTAAAGVIGLAGLLAVFVSPGVVVLALKAGAVPTALAFGVTGT